LGVIRTFIGIPLIDDFADAFIDACEAVKTADPSWRGEKWVPRQNMHVTLKFLGDIAEDDVSSLADTVARTAALQAAFDLADPGLRAVPNPRRARMLWGTFADPDGRCAALAAELDRACLAFGVPSEERTFKPHATLVRARRERHIQEAAIEAAREPLKRLPDRMSVPSITLYSSRLTSREPVYTVLRECRLRPT
jgi:RNA 2',3'-cyclic 3'-phosphodiesterase